jgi:glyoxylase-like metal-dependent hydrolase (beta-lactamase superfamily II)
MYFRILHDEASGAVSYLLADLDTRECVLIDPRVGDVAVLQAMLDEHHLNLRWLLQTHGHGTSLSDEAAALASLGAPRIQQAMAAPGAPPPEGCTMVFGNELLRAMPTPGHTTGCVSFLWRDRLFCGDLLSVDACPHQPRPALPEALWDSATRRVFTLPGETLLFCSHAAQGRAVSSVFEQRRWHPWFGASTRDEFLARVRAPTVSTPFAPQQRFADTP